MIDIGRFGLWLGALNGVPAPALRRVVREAESLGYGAVWVNEALGREAFTNAAIVLAATERIPVATGVANIWVRDAAAMANAARTLAEAYPGRFLLGVGASHRELVDRRGHRYRQPYTAMREYLDAMDATPFRSAPPPEPVPRILAALGPRMLALAAERGDGAHPYLVPPAHTARARAVLGPEPLLAPEQAVVLSTDPEVARGIARQHLRGYRHLANYRRNLERLGFGADALADGGSDEVVDALVAWGPIERVADRIREHWDEGADHVAVQVLTATPGEVSSADLAALAEALRQR